MQAMRFLALLAVLPLLAGCAATPIRIDQAERARLATVPVVQTVRYEPESFVVTTAGKAMFGLVGTGLAASAGTELRLTLGLDDPARAVQTRFLEVVSRDLGVKNVRAARAPAGNKDDPSALKATIGSGVVFDFRTTSWTIVYHPKDFGRYRTVYAGRARLVRVDDGKVLWQGLCSKRSDDDPATSPTYDELTANKGALLKATFAKNAALCADDLVAQFFDRVPAQTAVR